MREGTALAGPALEAELSPAAGVKMRSRRWEISAGYAPRFTRSLLGADARSTILHQARLAGTIHDRTRSLSVLQSGGYGSMSFTSFASDPGAAVGPAALVAALPSTDVLDYAWSQTGLLGRLEVTRKWALGLSLDYSLSGGTDARSRASVPFLIRLDGGISAEYAASRRNHVVSKLDASRALFSSGPEDTLVRGTLSWRHAWSLATVTTVAGGVGWATSGASIDGDDRSVAYPIASAAVVHRPRSGLVDLKLSVQLSPLIDRLSGHVDERLDSAASVGWRPTRALTVQGELGVARSISWSVPGAVALVSQGLNISYRAGDSLLLDGGVRSAWTHVRDADAPAMQWATFVGVTFTAPTLRF